MRLFIALDIDDAIRDRVARFIEGVRGFAPEARWVRPESLHVTLKFIGERPAVADEEIKSVLSGIKAEPLQLTFRGYGFFPGARAARIFWIGIDSGRGLASLAKTIDEIMAGSGIPKDAHAFSPHLTLARGGSGSGIPRRQKNDRPNLRFVRLQEKLASMSAPEFGTMTAREFCLYQSRLSPGGSRYTKIAKFPLQE